MGIPSTRLNRRPEKSPKADSGYHLKQNPCLTKPSPYPGISIQTNSGWRKQDLLQALSLDLPLDRPLERLSLPMPRQPYTLKRTARPFFYKACVKWVEKAIEFTVNSVYQRVVLHSIQLKTATVKILPEFLSEFKSVPQLPKSILPVNRLLVSGRPPEEDPLSAIFPQQIRSFFEDEEYSMQPFAWFKRNGQSHAQDPSATRSENAITDSGYSQDWVVFGSLNPDNKDRLKSTLSEWLNTQQTEVNPYFNRDAGLQNWRPSSNPASDYGSHSQTSPSSYETLYSDDSYSREETSSDPSTFSSVPKQGSQYYPDVQACQVDVAATTTLASNFQSVVPSVKALTSQSNQQTLTASQSPLTPPVKAHTEASPQKPEKRPQLDPRNLENRDQSNAILLMDNNRFLSHSINNLAQQYFENNALKPDDDLDKYYQFSD